MSRTVRGSFGQDDHHEESSQSTTTGRSSSGRKSRKNVERKPTFLSFFKVNGSKYTAPFETAWQIDLYENLPNPDHTAVNTLKWWWKFEQVLIMACLFSGTAGFVPIDREIG